MIDFLIEAGPTKISDLDKETVSSLYHKGLVYLEVPIEDDDIITISGIFSHHFNERYL